MIGGQSESASSALQSRRSWTGQQRPAPPVRTQANESLSAKVRAEQTTERPEQQQRPGVGQAQPPGADEACSLLAPAATGLEREDDQPATVGPQQFGIDTLLPQPRLNKSGAPRSPRTAAGLARRVQGRDQSGVDSQLGTATQGQPIRNDVKAPVIDVVNHQVEIGQAGVGGNPASRHTPFDFRNTPAREHAARWSPRESKRRWGVFGDGEWGEGAVSSGLVGRAVRTRPAKGPCCDSNSASAEG